jgi:hypothetical protein
LLLYATPIDIGTGVRLLGPALRENVARNVEPCRSAAAAAGGAIPDLSAALPDSSAFIDADHLAQDGRRRVASARAGAFR